MFFLHNCCPSLLVQIYKKPEYKSNVILLISFCLFFSRAVHMLALLSVSDTFVYSKYGFYLTVVLLNQLLYLRSRYTGAVLAFWHLSVTSIQKEHRFCLTVVLLYQFRYLGSKHTRTVLGFFSVYLSALLTSSHT